MRETKSFHDPEHPIAESPPYFKKTDPRPIEKASTLIEEIQTKRFSKEKGRRAEELRQRQELESHKLTRDEIDLLLFLCDTFGLDRFFQISNNSEIQFFLKYHGDYNIDKLVERGFLEAQSRHHLKNKKTKLIFGSYKVTQKAFDFSKKILAQKGR